MNIDDLLAVFFDINIFAHSVSNCSCICRRILDLSISGTDDLRTIITSYTNSLIILFVIYFVLCITDDNRTIITSYTNSLIFLFVIYFVLCITNDNIIMCLFYGNNYYILWVILIVFLIIIASITFSFLLLYFWDCQYSLLRAQLLVGSEPAGLTLHPPPPPNDRGWVHFFHIGV